MTNVLQIGKLPDIMALMVWRNWAVIAIVVLANYVVFSLLGTFIFPASPPLAPTHAAQPTFTVGVVQLKSVGTLTYDRLTPTATSTFTPTPTATATSMPTPTPTPASTDKPTEDWEDFDPTSGL